MSRTPAQVSGNYDFVTDVPIQGPTDPGMRAASCWWTQNVIPVKKPSCVDCGTGPVPTWAGNPSAWGGGPAVYGGNGTPCGWGKEAIRYEGSTLGSAGDPPATLTVDQQTWVTHVLHRLHHRIVKSTGSSCPSWQDPRTNQAAAVGCFQFWFNANANNPSFARPPTLPGLRIDGVLDQDTLNALLATAAAHPTDFPTPYPTTVSAPVAVVAPVASPAPVAPATSAAPAPSAPPAPPSVAHEKGLSTVAKVGIGAAAVTVIGGIVYAVTRKSS